MFQYKSTENVHLYMDDGDTPFPLPFDINFIGNMDNIFCVYLEVELYCFPVIAFQSYRFYIKFVLIKIWIYVRRNCWMWEALYGHSESIYSSIAVCIGCFHIVSNSINRNMNDYWLMMMYGVNYIKNKTFYNGGYEKVTNDLSM